MRLRSRRRAPRRPATFEPLESRCVLSSLSLGTGGASALPDDEEVPVAAEVVSADRFGDGVRLGQVRSLYGFTGRGQTVAVIDTGIAYDQQALGSGFGSQARVVGGWDVAEQDADPYDDGPAGFHGTHVAGIIASDDDRYPGVAPGVDLVAVRVFDDLGSGTMAWVEQALRWVDQNRDRYRYPITTVNLSLGTNYNGIAPPQWASLEDELQSLWEHGILVVAAAGNSFSQFKQPGLSYPAASPYVLPVGSLDADGNLSAFSQRLDRMLAAPGENIVSTVPDHLLSRDRINDDWAAASGTSMASPVVAGASAIVREAMSVYQVGQATPSRVIDVLRRTARPVADPVTGRVYSTLDLPAALASLIPRDDYGDDSESAYDLGSLTSSLRRTGLIATTEDRDVFRFQASTLGWIDVDVATSDFAKLEWNVVGAERVLREGQWVYQVDAGQEYFLEVTSSDRAGRYELDLQWEAAPAVELGAVSRTRLAFGQNDGTAAYAMTAARDGLLTFSTSSADSKWYVVRSDGTVVRPRPDARFGGRRVDLRVSKGERFTLITDTRAAWQLDILNRLRLRRGTLTIDASASGTTVIGLGTRVTVSIDGVRYSWKAEQVQRVVYDGTATDGDRLRIYGSRASEEARVDNGRLVWEGARTDIVARGLDELDLISGGGADDVLRVTGGDGADWFEVSPERVAVGSSRLRVRGSWFDRVYLDGAGGADTAVLSGSEGNDTLLSYLEEVRFFGPGFHVRIVGVEDLTVNAGTGDDDVARFFGSAAAESWLGGADRVSWRASDRVRVARSFDRVYAYGLDGAGDSVVLETGGDGGSVEVAADRIARRGRGFYQRVEGWRTGAIKGEADLGDRVWFRNAASIDRVWSEVGRGEWELVLRLLGEP